MIDIIGSIEFWVIGICFLDFVIGYIIGVWDRK